MQTPWGSIPTCTGMRLHFTFDKPNYYYIICFCMFFYSNNVLYSDEIYNHLSLCD